MGVKFSRVGKSCKIFSAKYMSFGNKVTMGDYCWIEAVAHYRGTKYSPKLIVGDDVRFSDAVHISCVENITIGNGVLFGSRIYIGDHAHGYGPNAGNIAPGDRELINFGAVNIGDRCWVGDGVVILANTQIHPDSVISANSVVQSLKTDRPAIVAGSPATVVKYLDNL